MRYSTWFIIATVAVILLLDWLLAVACSRHDRRQDYEELDDGTHEVKFDEQEDSGE